MSLKCKIILPGDKHIKLLWPDAVKYLIPLTTFVAIPHNNLRDSQSNLLIVLPPGFCQPKEGCGDMGQVLQLL